MKLQAGAIGLAGPGHSTYEATDTMNAPSNHPSLLRTTNAFATVGARQRRNALPAVVLAAAALCLQLGALASIFA